MRTITRIFLAGAVALVSNLSALAQDPAQASAEDVVKLVHLSRALKKHDLNGELRKGKVRAPFNIKLEEKLIRFKFFEPTQIINLDLGDKGYKLTEVKAGSNAAVPPALYAQGIRGTDLTYDDVSFRFLYWPNPVKLGDERTSTQKCWKVQLNNPTKFGAYTSVVIWVDQKSGSLLKMEGWVVVQEDGKPVQKLVKRCKVTSGMKVDDAMVLREMTVETFDAGTGKGQGKTFLEMSKP